MKRLHEIYNLALSFFIMVPKRRILPIQQGYWMSDSCKGRTVRCPCREEDFWWEGGFYDWRGLHCNLVKNREGGGEIESSPEKGCEITGAGANHFVIICR